MTSLRRLALPILGSVGLMATAAAQPADWDLECASTQQLLDGTYLSNPYLLQAAGNDLIQFAIGFSGTVNYGAFGNNGDGFCFQDQQTIPNTGKFAISVGPTGSIQKTSQDFDDDFMTYNVGAPLSPMWCYANTTFNGAKTYFPSSGFVDFFSGLSNRYIIASANAGGAFARLQVEVVADVVRMRWTLTNNTTESANIGLQWGMGLGMLTNDVVSAEDGTNSAHWSVFGRFRTNPGPGFVHVPGRRPPVTRQVIDRDSDPARFPDYVDFLFSQTDAFGVRVENKPSPDTEDIFIDNQPTEADRIYLGTKEQLLGAVTDAAPTLPSDVTPPDNGYLGDTAFVQRFPEEAVAPGASRTVLHYIRNPWGKGSYSLPYGAVVDAPKMIQNREVDFQGNPADGGLVPNPFEIQVWVDNVGGFGAVGKEVPLQDVRFKLAFPAGSGITVEGSNQRTLNSVPARELRSVKFQARASEDAVGDVPYTVTIESQPGNVKKVIEGVISVAGRPITTLHSDANLVGPPYTFTDSAWTAVLSNFTDPTIAGADAQVFEYDPLQQGYVISTSVRQGVGAFVIYDKPGGGSTRATYGGDPKRPEPHPAIPTLVQLRRGWNLIANPYNYRIAIAELVGVSDDPNNLFSYTYAELVDRGIISGYAAYFDPVNDQYEFVDGENGVLEPNRGYWILVTGSDELSLSFPELNTPYAPQSTSRLAVGATAQNEQQWRLNLVARTEDAIDSQNFIGIAENSKQVSKLRIFEPPMFPNQQLALAIEQAIDGKPTRLSQGMAERSSRMEWKVIADVRKAGSVTITWPNLGTVPKNLRFRLIDVATGAARDLRQASGYSFRAEEPGTREFRIEATAGSESRAVIGNVIVTRPSRVSNAPFTIAYTLSTDATTSVRILNAAGREVFTVSRGRADRAGENTVTWTLRDNANRAVAPGTYRVEIVAESNSGERVRKVVPVNVIR